MAIGVIIGAAFGRVVTSLVSDIIMPPVGMLTGGIDFSSLVIILKNSSDQSPEVAIRYGMFINTVVDFLIVAFVIFLVVRQINRMKKEEDAKQAVSSEDILLLREIRDSLRK